MKKYLIDNKDLMKEWDYEKNKDIDVDKITFGSHKRAWWRCNKGHEWTAIISDRIKGNGCPYCGNKSILSGYNDIFTIEPNLAKEWDYSKNSNIDPTKCGKGSHKKVWWICSKGHSYETSISSRVGLGTGCPYCSGRYAIEGENDLKTANPDILKEWDYNENELGPENFKLNSHKSVWWICSNCGHKWKAFISDRVRGNGCPSCSKELKTSMPEQILYYFIKKTFADAINSYKLPDSSYKGEIDIYIPSINLGIEYDGYNWHQNLERDISKNEILSSLGINLLRIREESLPILPGNYNIINCKKFNPYSNNFEGVVLNVFDFIENNYDVHISNKNINIEAEMGSILNNYEKRHKEKSIENMNSSILIDWNWDKNGELKPDMISYSSNKKIWWKCHKCGYEWLQSVNNRNKRGCPLCANRIVVKNKNDLATTHKGLIKDWDFEKNNIKPTEVTYGSEKKVWWKCHICGYEWESKIWNRSRGRGCPLCSNKIVIKGKNDLATLYPDLLKDWNFEKNLINPDDLTIGANKKIWWKCHKCGHEWETYLFNRTTHKSGCPICVRSKK